MEQKLVKQNPQQIGTSPLEMMQKTTIQSYPHIFGCISGSDRAVQTIAGVLRVGVEDALKCSLRV